MEIRPATSDDISLILSFIKKKSEFDRNIGAFTGELKVSETKISKTLFGDIPFAYVLFAEKSGKEIGFALYYFRYSSFTGQPILWLDDLYIDQSMRSQGGGTALMKYLVTIAKKNDCSHIAWTADIRNTQGIKFYHRLGAKIIKQEKNRCFFQWIPQITIN